MGCASPGRCTSRIRSRTARSSRSESGSKPGERHRTRGAGAGARDPELSDGVLQTFAVPPMLGRWLSQADQKPGSPPTVVLTYGYWQRHFGGDRSGDRTQADGGRQASENCRRDAERVSIPEFERRLNRADRLRSKPKRACPAFAFPEGIGRLKPGVTVNLSQRRYRTPHSDLERLWPFGSVAGSAMRGKSRRRFALCKDIVGNVSSLLWVVMGTIGVVMYADRLRQRRELTAGAGGCSPAELRDSS